MASTLTHNEPTVVRRKPPGKPVAASWAQAAVIFVIVVLVLESLFALGGVGEREYLVMDPALGFVPMPGRRITWREEGFSHTVFNKYGMRNADTTIAKPANTFRVAVLGDSMVEALQVDGQQTFC